VFDFLLTQELQDFEYYDNTLHLISLLVLSGNYWVPQGIPGMVNETNALQILIKAYPNPFNALLNVTVCYHKNTTLTLTVIDIYGNICFSKEINKMSGIYSESINLQFLSEGIYLLRAEINGNQSVTRLFKHHD
jgi:hypothetical protein